MMFLFGKTMTRKNVNVEYIHFTRLHHYYEGKENYEKTMLEKYRLEADLEFGDLARMVNTLRQEIHEAKYNRDFWYEKYQELLNTF